MWTADERVHACFHCRQHFTFLVRKHHCRVCGRIFCHDCSKYKTTIPSFIRHFIATSIGSTNADGDKRVCIACYNQTCVANACKNEIYIVANLPLEVREMGKLAVLSKTWNGAINSIHTIWNSIQYKLPHTRFSKLEQALLRTRYSEISGHSAWVIQTIKGIGKVPASSTRATPCAQIFCQSSCTPRLQVFHLLELYTHLHEHSKKIDRWAAKAWEVVPLEQHRHMMPWWVHIFRTRPYIALNVFTDIIKNDLATLFSFLFEMKLQAASEVHSTVLWATINKCLERVALTVREQWEEADKFLELLHKISKHDYDTRREREIAEWMIQGNTVKCPWNPDVEIHGIGMKPVRLNTASKPLKITLYTTKGSVDILYKNEDVRKDRMTLDIAYWIELATEQAVTFKRYFVMPFTSKSGIVEMLPGVTTLYDVKHKYNTSLQNFILDRNAQLTVNDLRQRFIKSVAAACVLSYVLGVGDRHLENMLVTDNGELIHVDFSYLLGDDPKHVKTEMRITPDILEALGGQGSASFTEFQELCSDVYRKLRTKSSFWYCLLMYLADASPRIVNFWGERARIQQHVLERLCPGELDSEASMQIVDIVKRSSHDTWKLWGVDTAHALAKQAGGFFTHDTLFNLEL